MKGIVKFANVDMDKHKTLGGPYNVQGCARKLLLVPARCLIPCWRQLSNHQGLWWQ